jgi:hypothetical protein
MPPGFEWDPEKAERNLRDHGVTFEEASTSFVDPYSIVIEDPEHSLGEERFILLGVSARGRLLVVVHTDREDHIRLISAWKADRHYLRIYEQDL